MAGLVHGGLVWFWGWYQTWMLYLMANEPLGYTGNDALFSLGTRIRRFRRRLPELVGTAIAAPEAGESLPMHGCYFAATGTSPESMACAGGSSVGESWKTPPLHAGPPGRSFKTGPTDGWPLPLALLAGALRSWSGPTSSWASAPCAGSVS